MRPLGNNTELDKSYKEEIKRIYNIEAYIRENSEETRWKTPEITRFKSYLEKYQKKTVLDVGCGVGKEAAYLKENGFNVIGIDIAEENIKICKKKKIQAYVMDFYKLNFSDESFDAVLALSSLLHAPKKHFPLIIQEIERVLKPQGIFYIGMFTGFYDGVLPSYGDRYVALYQKDELLSMFEENFSVLNITRFRPDKTRRYISFILKKES